MVFDGNLKKIFAEYATQIAQLFQNVLTDVKGTEYKATDYMKSNLPFELAINISIGLVCLFKWFEEHGFCKKKYVAFCKNTQQKLLEWSEPNELFDKLENQNIDIIPIWEKI